MAHGQGAHRQRLRQTEAAIRETGFVIERIERFEFAPSLLDRLAASPSSAAHGGHELSSRAAPLVRDCPLGGRSYLVLGDHVSSSF